LYGFCSFKTTRVGKVLIEIEQFLKQYSQFEKPLLLGFSGGPDSLTLAHILLSLKHPFHIAHFDHSWREESKKECKELENWARSHHIPFHFERSQFPKLSENGARDERFAFFEKLFANDAFEALLLAHHQSDHIETILKRMLEGAHLINCRGIEPVSFRGKMLIWRPLLETPKQKILKYLKENSLKPIQDKTNFDTKYLRARMRKSILPQLSKEFGKEVAGPLVSIGKQAKALKNYLDEKTSHYLPVEGPFGKMWDFSGAHLIEIEHVLSKSFSFSRPILEKVTNAVEALEANYHVHFGEHKLIVDRQKVFWIKKKLPQFRESIPLKPGKFLQEGWEWEIQTMRSTASSEEGWLSWWKGKISLALPEGACQLAPASSDLRKKWQKSKVPAFMRDFVPAIFKNEKLVTDFFTEKKGEDYPLSVKIHINHRG